MKNTSLAFLVTRMLAGSTVRVKAIIPGNNPTYLNHGGIFDATCDGESVYFKNPKTGAGTYERVAMLKAFETGPNRVTFELVEATV